MMNDLTEEQLNIEEEQKSTKNEGFIEEQPKIVKLPIPRVGGMATPFGVFLTTGKITAGANKIHMLSVGIFMVLLFTLVEGILLFILATIAKFLPNFLPIFYSVTTNTGIETSKNITFIISLILPAFTLVLFFILMRFLPPVVGYHAAEHKVVNLIEKEQELTLENMEKESPVHPRCGTNIGALVMLLYIAVEVISMLFKNQFLQNNNSIITGVILVITILIMARWQDFGAFLQKYFTTAKPSKKQMQNAINVANELLEKYYSSPYESIQFGKKRGFNIKRFASSGVIYILAGAFITQLFFHYMFPVLDGFTQILVKYIH